jgi:hypothetical protein
MTAETLRLRMIIRFISFSDDKTPFANGGLRSLARPVRCQ